ncbi:hypothetical protein MALG_04666 (plasmid) [Marinovum algicola DG 898]|nr:hypothetical protein MALG_04666 [Marinovum algicola DG 898]
MRHLFKKLLPSVAVALTMTGLSVPMPARAQTYPIDCAILLCLSGGWPASMPCARARAEFIRRITPWPVEPPLQIWRCPMGVSYAPEHPLDRATQVIKASQPLHISSPAIQNLVLQLNNAQWDAPEMNAGFFGASPLLRFVQDRAAIDISGPEFNFVRSIRVYDVRFASQRIAGENDQCRRFALVYLGTYGTQGEFTWAVSSPAELPDAHVGLEGWGSDCPNLYDRSVFVDWRDFEGEYGFEQVQY